MNNTPVQPSREEVLEYVSAWQQRLYLSAWTIGVRFDSVPEGRAGECVANPATWEAGVSLNLDVACCAPLDWQQVVIHELLHVVCARVHQADHVAAEATGRVGAALAQIKEAEVEAVIELLARVLRDAERAEVAP